mgnify:CR=1 FL=1
MKLLKIEDLHVYYGGIHALKGITLEVPENKIVTLVGANGAGKSTTLRAISSLVPIAQGKIIFRGQDIIQTKTGDIAKKGDYARTPGPSCRGSRRSRVAK